MALAQRLSKSLSRQERDYLPYNTPSEPIAYPANRAFNDLRVRGEDLTWPDEAHPRETPDLEVLFSQSDGPRIRERITRDLAQDEITPLKGCEH